MKKRHLLYSIIFIMTGLVTFATGYSVQADNTKTTESSTSETMQKIEPKKDTYVIASDSAFAPFEFQNADGEYEGIDVKLMEAISKLQGINIRMDYRGFSAALQALDSGQADGMISGMTVTDERKQSYDFSYPYFNSGIQIAVKKAYFNQII